MWLAFLLSAAICPAGEVPVEVRALDPGSEPLVGAEIREGSGKNRLLGVTGPDGRATVCVGRSVRSLGVQQVGFVTQWIRLKDGGDTAEVRLKAECVTGTARDGSFRLCGADLARLPLQK